LAPLLLTAPVPALANGRFPAANQLVVHPTDPQQILVRVTFGVLLSRDGGQSFSWICEKAVGYGGVQDPAVALTSNGSLLIAAFEGLAISHDGGCSFAFVKEAEKEFVIDVAVDKGNPSSAVAVTSTGKGGLTFNVQVLETTDAGSTWSLIGTPIDPALLAETIDPAPSRKQRLYVSGFSSVIVDGKQIRSGALMVSDDRGTTWERRDLDLGADQSVYIAAVDPQNPDRVFLRTRGIEEDRLLLTEDAGKSFTTLTTVPGSMLGFALSPDGKKVAIGGPSAGVRVADTSSFQFVQVSSIENACLTWTTAGLYACANPFKDGFAVGISFDEGASWQPLLASYTALTGPISGCPTDPSPAAVCAQEWAQLKATLGIGEGGSGGTGASSGASGASPGRSPSSAGGTQPSADPDATDNATSSCDCTSAGARIHPASLAALGLVLAGLVRAARRQR
ncbi:MAG: hypothetical protein NZX77_22610, partial [Polyangiaceae bacterium]|nr:hypothetical protein [Polyangiaceae bacterium]